MGMTIEQIKQAVLPACRNFGVRRLDVFGSVAEGTAAPTSDVDLLVEFNEPDRKPSKRYFGLVHHLEDTLGCEVDLLTSSSLRNPYFQKRVADGKVSLYEG